MSTYDKRQVWASLATVAGVSVCMAVGLMVGRELGSSRATRMLYGGAASLVAMAVWIAIVWALFKRPST